MSIIISLLDEHATSDGMAILPHGFSVHIVGVSREVSSISHYDGVL